MLSDNRPPADPMKKAVSDYSHVESIMAEGTEVCRQWVGEIAGDFISGRTEWNDFYDRMIFLLARFSEIEDEYKKIVSVLKDKIERTSKL